MEKFIEKMSKLTTNEVRTFNMPNRFGQDAPYYLIGVSSGDLYMKESEEGEFGHEQIRENADIYVNNGQRVIISKPRMLISKWSVTTALGATNQFHILEF
jgi:hypothetical protein